MVPPGCHRTSEAGRREDRPRLATPRLSTIGPRCDVAIDCESADNAARTSSSRHGRAATFYERWDGKGNPSQLRGDAIAVPARVLGMSFEIVAKVPVGGVAAAIELVEDHRGRAFDPTLADAFLKHAGELLPLIAAPSVWDEFLETEPAPTRSLTGSVADVAHAFACFVDVKSPFTLGHSTGTARLAAAAAAGAGMSSSDCD
jgi:hypothetical protein